MAAHKKWCVLLFWLLHFSVAIAGRTTADADSSTACGDASNRPGGRAAGAAAGELSQLPMTAQQQQGAAVCSQCSNNKGC